MTPEAPALRPWSPIPILESGEPLESIPPALLRLEPHPYLALGAPYGAQADPFRLRSGVVQQLLAAERHLAALGPGCRLLIFDAWRPLAVQRFMVAQAIGEQCRLQGVDPQLPSAALAAIGAEVGRFWAPPSEDPATPPPHSTGAAVDLTLAGPEDPAGEGAPGEGPPARPGRPDRRDWRRVRAQPLCRGCPSRSQQRRRPLAWPAPAVAPGDGNGGFCPAPQRVVAFQPGRPTLGLAHRRPGSPLWPLDGAWHPLSSQP